MKPEPMIGEEDVTRAIMLPHPDPPTDYIRGLARAAISAHLTALERAGWKCVPMEPTREMVTAGNLAVSRMPMDTIMGAQLAGSNRIISAVKMRARWVAMLAAAPPPQNSDEVK